MDLRRVRSVGMRFLGTLLAAGFLATPARAQPLSELFALMDTPERALLKTAGELFSQGRYPAAAKHYRDFLKEHGKSSWRAEAQMMLAECLFRQAAAEAGAGAVPEGPFREAAKAYQAALRDVPKGDALGESIALRLAEIEFNLRRYEETLKAVDRLTGEYSGGLLRGEARLLKAQALLALRRAPEAAAEIKGLLKDQSFYQTEPRLALAYGVALYEVGNSSGALPYLERLDTPYSRLYAARALMDLGQPLVALEHLRRVPQLDRDGPWVEISKFLAAEAFFASRDYRSAKAAYEQFLRDYPQSNLKAGALFKIGFAQFELEEYLAARGSFQSVLQLFAKSEFAPLALYMTAESFLREGRVKEAGFAYADMESSYSGELAGNAQFKLAWTFLKQGDYAAAAAAGRQLLTKRPDHPLAPVGAVLMGNTLTRDGRYGEAVLAYQRALDMLKAGKLEEGRRTHLQEATLALLSRANLMAKDYGRLVSGYRRVLEEMKPTLNPWRAASLLYIGEGYFRQGFYDQALKLYREVLRSFPAAPESAYALDGAAWTLARKGEYVQSELERLRLPEYRQRPAVAPSKTVLRDGKLPDGLFAVNEYEIASARFNRKKFLEALDAYETFEKAHAGHPLAPEAALQAGWCLYRMEYYGQAVKAWERVETQYPRTPTAAKAAWSTADTYFRAGQYENAIAAYRRILQSYPEDKSLSHARLRIAQAHYNAKDVLKAIGAFEELLRDSPEAPEAAQVLDLLTQLLYRPDAKDAALEALRRVGEANQASMISVQARYRVARHVFDGGNYAAAAAALEPLTARLIEAKDLAEAQYMLAESYYRLNRFQEAAWAYDRFTVNYPSDDRYVAALFHLGASRFKLEEFAGAAEAFMVIHERFPKSSHAPVAIFNAALAYRKLGQWEQASLALKTYMKEHPEAAKTSNAVAELLAIYEEHRRFDAAVELIGAQRESLPPDDARRVELTYRLGEAYMGLGQEEKAVEAYRELMASRLKGDEFRLSGLAKLGEYYERVESWAEALAVYEDLARSSQRPDWAEAAKARAAAARERLKSASAKGAEEEEEKQ